MQFGNEFWLILFQEYIIPKLFAVCETFLDIVQILFFPSENILYFLLMICISLLLFVLALSSLPLSPANLLSRRDLLFQNGGHASCLGSELYTELQRVVVLPVLGYWSEFCSYWLHKAELPLIGCS
jgi:hypothetical protein